MSTEKFGDLRGRKAITNHQTTNGTSFSNRNNMRNEINKSFVVDDDTTSVGSHRSAYSHTGQVSNSRQQATPKKYKQKDNNQVGHITRSNLNVCESFRDDGFCSACPDKCNKTHVLQTLVPWTNIGAELPTVSTEELCQQFRDLQECVNAQNCRYLHVVDPSKVPSKGTRMEFHICQQYRDEGYCPNCPQHCELSHVAPTGTPWTRPNGSLPVNKLPQGVLCRGFQKHQTCKKQNCSCIHVLDAKNVPTVPPVSQSKVPSVSKSKFPVCLQYRDNGFCSNCPSKCKLNHLKPTKVSWTHPGQEIPTNPTEEQCQRFRDFKSCDLDISCPYLHVVNPKDVPTKPPKALENKHKVNEPLDIVLVMDCTNGMDNWLQAAKDQLSKLATEFNSKAITARLGFVGFRDYDNCPPESRIVSTGLTSDIAVVQDVLNRETAAGAGDMPDDVVGGLQAALEMQWDAPHRMIVLVTDAPCHGGKYHECFFDSRSDPIDGEPNIEDQMREMARRGISFVIIETNPKKTSTMVSFLKSAFKEVDTNLLFQVVHNKGDTKGEKAVEAARGLITETITDAVTKVLKITTTVSEEKETQKVSTINSHEKLEPVDTSEKVEDTDSVNPWFGELLPHGSSNWNALTEIMSEPAICYTFTINKELDSKGKMVVDESFIPTDIKIFDKGYFNNSDKRTFHEFVDMRFPNIQYVAQVFKYSKSHSLESYKNNTKNGLKSEAKLQPSKTDHVGFVYELTDRPSIDYFKYVVVEKYSK